MQNLIILKLVAKVAAKHKNKRSQTTEKDFLEEVLEEGKTVNLAMDDIQAVRDMTLAALLKSMNVIKE